MNFYGVKGQEYPWVVECPEYSYWVCHLFGSNGDGISYRPLKRNEPNFIHRWLQKLCFNNTWIKLK